MANALQNRMNARNKPAPKQLELAALLEHSKAVKDAYIDATNPAKKAWLKKQYDLLAELTYTMAEGY